MKMLDVEVTRQAIASITKVLGQKNIPVLQQGSQAMVVSDPDTGKPVKVVLPYLPDNATPELVAAIHGFLDHEVGHILFSDFPVLSESARKGTLVKELTNMIEDTYVERRMARKYLGSGSNLDKVRDFFARRFTDKALEKALAAGDRGEVEAALMVPLLRAKAGQSYFESYMRDKWALVEDVIEVLGDTLDRVKDVKSSRDSLELAIEMADRIAKSKDQQPQEGDQQQEPQQNSGKSGKSSLNEPDDGESGEGEESEDGQEGDEDEGDEQDNEQGDEQEAEGTGADEDQGESQEGEEPGDDGMDPGDDEGESGEDGDSGEEEADGTAQGGQGEGDDSDEEGEAQGQESDQGEAGGESIGGNEGVGEDADDEGGPEELDEGGDPQEIESATPSGGQNSSGGGAVAKSMALDENKLSGFEEAVGEAMSSSAQELIGQCDYKVFTKDKDVIERAEYDPALFNDPDWVENMAKFRDGANKITGALSKVLERLVKAKSAKRALPGQRSGKIDGGSLFKLKTGDTRVFKSVEQRQSRESAGSIVVDLSGSMSGRKVEIAMAGAYAVSSVLQKLNIPHEVIGFTTKYDPELVQDCRDDYDKTGIEYARVEAIHMPVLKEFGERLGAEQLKRMTVAASSMIGMGSNIDGESILIAAARLKRQKEPGKFMIVLSDGNPAGSGWSGPMALRQHLKQATQEIEASGIKLVGIGIQDRSVTGYYKNHVVVNSVEELPKAMVAQLQKIIL